MSRACYQELEVVMGVRLRRHDQFEDIPNGGLCRLFIASPFCMKLASDTQAAAHMGFLMSDVFCTFSAPQRRNLDAASKIHAC